MPPRLRVLNFFEELIVVATMVILPRLELHAIPSGPKKVESEYVACV